MLTLGERICLYHLAVAVSSSVLKYLLFHVVFGVFWLLVLLQPCLHLPLCVPLLCIGKGRLESIMSSNIPQDYPVVPPPPGVFSNFVDPESRSSLVIAITSICAAITWVVVTARLYVKLRITKTFGWDDGELVNLRL